MYVKAWLVEWSALNPNRFSEYQTAPKHFTRRRRSPSVQTLWCLVGLSFPPGSEFLVECNVTCFVFPRFLLCVCSNRASGDMVSMAFLIASVNCVKEPPGSFVFIMLLHFLPPISSPVCPFVLLYCVWKYYSIALIT